MWVVLGFWGESVTVLKKALPANVARVEMVVVVFSVWAPRAPCEESATLLKKRRIALMAMEMAMFSAVVGRARGVGRCPLMISNGA